VAEVALEVLRLQEHQRPVAPDQAEPGRAGAEVRPVAEQVELDDRGRDAVLDEPERRQERQAESRDADRRGRGPAPLLALHERDDDRREPAADRDHARDVDPSRRRLVALLRRRHQHKHHAEQAERQVEPEQPPPADRVDQGAADDRSHTQRQCRHTGPDPERAGALVLREGGRDEREREPQQRGRAQPLEDASPDQHRLGARRRGHH